MSSLVIDHGNPWWLSPNVWAVPTSNPNEPSPGEVSPVVNDHYYLAANVRNTSGADVLNATVYFFWADPSLGVITTANAHAVGMSSVSVPASASNTSLELQPWTPSFVNNGHECLIAAVVEGGGPPPMVLDGANDPTVAQRNLGVVKLGMHREGRFSYPFQVCNPFRGRRRFTVHAERAPIDQAAPFLASLRGASQASTKGENASHLRELGFVQVPCPHPRDVEHARPVLEDIHLEPYACTGFTLVGAVEKGDALIHVTQQLGEKIVGGLSILVLREREDSHERRS